MRCNNKSCCEEAEPPFKTCFKCRKIASLAARKSRELNPDKAREKDRRRLYNYLASGKPSALAYIERKKIQTNKSNLAWCAANRKHRREQVVLLGLLKKALDERIIAKPKKCQRCGEKKLLISYNKRFVDGLMYFDGWYCWACVYAIERKEGPHIVRPIVVKTKEQINAEVIEKLGKKKK